MEWNKDNIELICREYLPIKVNGYIPSLVKALVRLKNKTDRNMLRIPIKDKISFVEKNLQLFTDLFDNGREDKDTIDTISHLARMEFGYSDKTINSDICSGFRKAHKILMSR